MATLATLPGHAGTPVATTIDPAVQRAAEAALSGETKNAALVAVNAQTGAILAAANANSGDFDQALDGAYPPGSTFKVITSTALIDKGLSPSSAASCPAVATVDGEVFHNAEGEGQVSDLLHAFAESCNTAFIGLATKNLTPSDFPSTAAMYRLGQAPQMGLAGVRRVGAHAVGRGRPGRHLHRPGAGAGLAAEHGHGRRRDRHRHRARPAPGHRGAGRYRGDQAAAGQRRHRPAPDDGAGRGDRHRGGPGPASGTYAKTGTAEYGTTNPLKIDAWLIGFRGNLAFAVLVVDAPGDGGPTDGPIAAKFLDSVGSQAG